MSEKRHFWKTDNAVPLPSLTKFIGLGSAHPDTVFIKDTDSAFVRLSKEGGHKDLLKMDLPRIADKPKPVAYSRNAWYYHLDNAEEDVALKTANNESGGSSVLDSMRRKPRRRGMEYNRSSEGLLQMDLTTTVEKTDPVPYLRNPWYYQEDNLREDYRIRKATSYKLSGCKDPKTNLRPDASKSSQGVQIPTHGLRKMLPEKPVFSKPRMRNNNNSANPRVFGTMAAEESNARMDKIMANAYQQEWEDLSKAHRQRLQARETKAKQQPETMYNRTFGPGLQACQRRAIRHASVQSRYRLPAKKPDQQLEPQTRPLQGKAAGEAKNLPALNKVLKGGPKVNAKWK